MTDLNTQEQEALYDLVVEELQAIKTEELEEGYAPDMVEVELLVNLAGKLGTPVLWEEIEPIPDENEGGESFLQSSL